MSTPSTSFSDWLSRSSFATTFTLLSTLAACGGGGATGTGGNGTGGAGGNGAGGSGGHGIGGAMAAPCEAGCPGGYTCTNGVCTGGDALGIALEVTTYPVSGTITIDGQTPMDATCALDVVDIELSRTVPHDAVSAAVGTWAPSGIPCGTTDGAFSLRAPKGKYVALAHAPSGSFVAAPAFEVTGPMTDVSWALTTVPLSGTLVADGMPPAANSYCKDYSGQVSLDFSTDSGARFSAKVACAATDGAFSTKVAPGTYRVKAEKNAGTSFPLGSFVVTNDLAVSAPATTAALEVGLVDVSGKLLADGQPPTAGCVGGQANIVLVNDQGASFNTSVGCGTPDGGFSLLAAPGTYRVVIKNAHVSSNIPQGEIVVDPALVVDGAKSGITWNISPTTISGTFDVDGVPALSLANCADVNFNMELRSADGSSFLAHPDCQTGWSAEVVPGAYRVIASRYPWGGGKYEEFVPVTDLVVTGPQTGIALSVTTIAVGGTLRLEGAPPVGNACTGGQVKIFLNGARGNRVEADIDCASATGAWSARVTPGLYEISVVSDGTVSVVDAIDLR